MTHFNFSRWREKTVRRASGEPDEGQGHELRFLFCFRALTLNWRVPRRLLPPAGEVDSASQTTPCTRVKTYDRWYNGSNSHFAVFDKAWATGFFLPNSSFNTTFRSVGATVIGSGSGTYSNAQVKFVSQAPATILNTSRFINIPGQIKNFDFNVGCTVNFTSSLTKSPY